MAISLLHGVSPQRNGVSLSGSCRRKKTAFLYRFLSSTKENGEISLVVALGEEAKWWREFTGVELLSMTGHESGAVSCLVVVTLSRE
ncbi:hypothetical protein YC2023_083942 [Brassica napus]